VQRPRTARRLQLRLGAVLRGFSRPLQQHRPHCGLIVLGGADAVGLPFLLGHRAATQPHPSGKGGAGWVSKAELQSNPHAIPGRTVTFRSAPSPGGITPDSASGCNEDVCINIDGASTIVNSWSTTAFGNVGCTRAYFLYNEGFYEGPEVCPDGAGDGVYYDNTGPSGYFPDGDQLCNSWLSIAGLPCEYIVA